MMSIAILLTVFALLFLRVIIPTEEEKKYEKKYYEICSALIGYYYTSMPFVKVVFFKDFLMILAIKKYILFYEEIDEIKEVFFVGLRLKHHSKNLPKRIILWPNDETEFLTKLKEKINKS